VRIEFVEIANLRKLRAVRVSFSKDKTVFVGANNSGKTSAMVALRCFLVSREQGNFTLNDFTLSGWPKIDDAGSTWEKAHTDGQPLPSLALDDILPFLDLWLHVEVHAVALNGDIYSCVRSGRCTSLKNGCRAEFHWTILRRQHSQ
jgi:AAA ATPase domain